MTLQSPPSQKKYVPQSALKVLGMTSLGGKKRSESIEMIKHVYGGLFSCAFLQNFNFREAYVHQSKFGLISN